MFTIVGVFYTLMASSMLLRGVGVLRDFAVPEHLLQAPDATLIFVAVDLVLALAFAFVALAGLRPSEKLDVSSVEVR